MKRVLFLDRDGTLIIEPEDNFQVDSLEKLEFYPGVIRNLYYIENILQYKLVMVSNQDGLGTDSYPEEVFKIVQDKIIGTFANEGIEFQDILIDPSLPEDHSPNRKPGIGMLKGYMDGTTDMSSSYVIGDRITDIKLAKNMGCKAILIGDHEMREKIDESGLAETCVLITKQWDEIYSFLAKGKRKIKVDRNTKETVVSIELDLDGEGEGEINTGLGFFDHMLEQISRHSGCNLKINVKGDLEVDEHHTIEDTALVLGKAFHDALGDKKGTERYGFMLPMDDCLAQVAIDFGGRPWLEWKADFRREKIGDVPTEMFYHFFRSFSDTARCNLNIKAEGKNEHHKIEAIFKSFARAIKMAVKRNPSNQILPSTKGML